MTGECQALGVDRGQTAVIIRALAGLLVCCSSSVPRLDRKSVGWGEEQTPEYLPGCLLGFVPHPNLQKVFRLNARVVKLRRTGCTSAVKDRKSENSGRTGCTSAVKDRKSENSGRTGCTSAVEGRSLGTASRQAAGRYTKRHFRFNARVVKLVDTRDSKSRALKSVPVRVRPLVPNKKRLPRKRWPFFIWYQRPARTGTPVRQKCREHFWAPRFLRRVEDPRARMARVTKMPGAFLGAAPFAAGRRPEGQDGLSH